MWKLSEEPKIVIANRALINHFYEMERVPRERPLSERRMMLYERIYRSGHFRSVTWASALCVETNCVNRVNGQHTSTMLSKIPDPLPYPFHVTVERYICDTLADLANLYNTFDSSMASRTISDINLSFASTIPELREIDPRTINLATTAISEEKWEEHELRKVPPAERAEELFDNTDFVLWLYRDILLRNHGRSQTATGSHGSILPVRRTSVIRAMLSTYRKNKAAATEFWEAVRDETEPDRNAPTRMLTRYLNSISLGGGSSTKGDKSKRIVVKREVYVKCILAWNAWRTNERTNLSYRAGAQLPKVSK